MLSAGINTTKMNEQLASEALSGNLTANPTLFEEKADQITDIDFISSSCLMQLLMIGTPLLHAVI
jgi:hypothetical protein